MWSLIVTCLSLLHVVLCQNAPSNVTVSTDASGKPMLTVEFDGKWVNGGERSFEWYRSIDNCTISQPFISSGIEYNSHGHAGGLSLKDAQYAATLPPDQVLDFVTAHSSWTIPHFDLHYYVVDVPTIQTLNDSTTTPAPSQYLPANFSCPPIGFEKRMGLHCFNVTKDYSTLGFSQAPELIYGAYDGKVHFLETMFSLDFLKRLQTSGEGFMQDIPQPSSELPFSPFPTEFVFRYDQARDIFVVQLRF